MRSSRLAAAALALVAAFVFARVHADEARAGPRQVVVFIGDGMGIAHVTLGRLAAERLKQPYSFDRFRTIGLAETRSANNVVTDSAAASTALSSGYKTNNGFLGLDAERRPRRTLLEIAKKHGFATGLVTTTRITHATPAGYASHVVDRNAEADVADQYLDEGVDVLLGGGRHYMDAKHQKALEAKGYKVAHDPKELAAALSAEKLLGVFADEHMSYEIERDPAREPSLREMTEACLSILSRDGKPFICMIEGGRIDHAGHVHDGPALVRDQLAFADAIDAALERVERQGDLLVLATADHTTGGLAISEKLDLDGLLAAKASVEGLLAREPIEQVTKDLPGFQKTVKESFGVFPDQRDLDFVRRGGKDYGLVHLGHFVAERRGLGFYDVDFQHHDQPATHGHEGSLVPVYAAGKGAEAFAGTYENTRIAHELARLLGLPDPGGAIPEPGRRYY
jgi:alkaline phosphatase